MENTTMLSNLFLDDIYSYLSSNQTSVIEDWLELIRHVSISATGEGIETCCNWLKLQMEQLHISVTKYPLKPSPVLIGKYGSDPTKKTVLVYAHYDVKPAGDLNQWLSDPFVPEIRDKKVYARGSADNKSPLMAHLKALEYYQKRNIDVPVNLIYLFEGCEEEGSIGLQEFLQQNKKYLHADLVFFSDGPKDPCGLPIIALGAKGDLSLRVTLRTMNRNVHSRYAPVLPSAAWQLIELLGKLKQGDKILIPGFFDGMIHPTEKELKLMQGLPPSEEELNSIYQAKPSNYGSDFYPRLLSSPTFNICSLKSGANGVVPATAEAILDIRLVPGQQPEHILNLIRDYISSLGYDNVETSVLGSTEPSKTDITTPYLPVIEEVTKAIYGNYVIYPCRPSSAPDYLWTSILDIPAIQVRWSDADSDNHAPNEHLSIQEYLDGIALTASVWMAISNMKD